MYSVFFFTFSLGGSISISSTTNISSSSSSFLLILSLDDYIGRADQVSTLQFSWNFPLGVSCCAVCCAAG